MPRRVNLPPADELFRKTAPDGPAAAASESFEMASGPSGRVRHTEKMTVYLTSEELLALEQARLKLRAELGRSIDRGRLVRRDERQGTGAPAERTHLFSDAPLRRRTKDRDRDHQRVISGNPVGSGRLHPRRPDRTGGKPEFRCRTKSVQARESRYCPVDFVFC